ncbi:immunoglobulin lambda-1 light chain-like [Callorhinchus milii]|uniref:immunoglobulin lambda-1 light chain-like n=1 Tax=Callorhinchus milii TaxID=7868 RepID=UPI001C3FD85A|nr:immunoglobulin lambda-1 light chain-like [Callorhinchus milii]
MGNWLQVLAALLMCLHDTTAAVTLTQPTSISTSPGNTVKITCIMSGATRSGNYWTSWYQQKPGSGPVFVWDETRGTAGSIPGRFTGSVDSSMHLTISGVQPEDAADYYCGAQYAHSPYNFLFGTGTKLSLRHPRGPSVTVLPPSPDQITAKNKATLVCLVNDFIPGAVEVEWTVDGSARSQGVETSAIKQQADNTYSVSSYLTLPTSEWESHDLYSCVVKHETLATPLEKSIARSSCT